MRADHPPALGRVKISNRVDDNISSVIGRTIRRSDGREAPPADDFDLTPYLAADWTRATILALDVLRGDRLVLLHSATRRVSHSGAGLLDVIKASWQDCIPVVIRSDLPAVVPTEDGR